jgi:hypothetical protein
VCDPASPLLPPLSYSPHTPPSTIRDDRLIPLPSTPPPPPLARCCHIVPPAPPPCSTVVATARPTHDRGQAGPHARGSRDRAPTQNRVIHSNMEFGCKNESKSQSHLARALQTRRLSHSSGSTAMDKELSSRSRLSSMCSILLQHKYICDHLTRSGTAAPATAGTAGRQVLLPIEPSHPYTVTPLRVAAIHV